MYISRRIRTSWGGLSAVSFGILFHLFSASIFSQKVFRGSKLTRVFLQPFCNLRLWPSTGTWQAGCDRRAHGEDIRLKSSASASEWHEYRGPRNPLILQDVSASFGGLGVIQRLGPTSRVCAQNGQRTKRAILVTHNSDDGRYSNSEICRTSDLRRRPCSLRGHIFADTHALDHPHTTASASPTDRDAAAIKPKSVRHADPA